MKDDTLIQFIHAPITGDLSEVPGIGPATKKSLATLESDDPNSSVTTTFQLIGKFLSLKSTNGDGEVIGSVEHMEKFWYWLQSKGVVAHRGAIVKAVAEKMNTMMPGLYDESAYE